MSRALAILVLAACTRPGPPAPGPIAHRADRATPATAKWRFVDEATEPQRRQTTAFTLAWTNERAALDIDMTLELPMRRKTIKRSRRYVGTVKIGPKIEIAVTATTEYDEQNPYDGSMAAYEITLECERTVLGIHPSHAKLVPPQDLENCSPPVGTWSPPGTIPHEVLACDVPSHGRFVFGALPGVMQRRYARMCDDALGGLRLF